MPTRQIVRFPAPRTAEVVEEPLASPNASEVRVCTTLSAISPGTEGLIYRNQAPDELAADASIGALHGGLTFPISYGYAAVGRVDELGDDVDSDWMGQRVFAFQPHASHFVAPVDDLIPLPDAIADKDGVMIPNLETAVNLVMDGQPVVGERVVVFGQGVVGLLTTGLLSRFPLESLYAVEPTPSRQRRARRWGSDRVYAPEDVSGSGEDSLSTALGVSSRDAVDASTGRYEGADLVFEVSGQPDVLDDALAVSGFDARVILGSWYGAKRCDVDLGGRFHRSRIQLVASQVSSIHPRERGRWSKKRRMSVVVNLLDDLHPGKLISGTYPVEEAPDVYDRLCGTEDSAELQPVFRYDH